MKFIKENKALIVVICIVLLFILSIIITPNRVSLIEDKHVTEWLEAASKDKITVLTLGQTTCSHCIAFKPTAEKFVNKYDVDWYWINVDQGAALELTEEDAQILNEQFPDFSGTPYTVIYKSGKQVDKINGRAEYADVVEIIKDANGGELKER